MPKKVRIDLPGSKQDILPLLTWLAKERGISRSELVVQILEEELIKAKLLNHLNRSSAVPIIDGKVQLDADLGMKPLFGKQ